MCLVRNKQLLASATKKPGVAQAKGAQEQQPPPAEAAAAVDNGAAEEVSAEDPGGGVYAEVEQQQQPPRDDASVDSGVIRCGVNLVDATAAVVAAATELLINEEPVPAGIAGLRLVPVIAGGRAATATASARVGCACGIGAVWGGHWGLGGW